jgi:integrase
MYSKTLTGRASKGSVSIVSSNGRLQLRFRFAGKRHYISLGFADTPQNRKLAEMRAREIELDILAGHFDESLAKYKPQSAQKKDEPEEITPKITPTIQEIWTQYTSYKASSVKETTRLYYESFARLFERLGDVPLLEALRVKEGLEKLTSVHQTKKTLMQLNAACKWGMKHGLIDSNPYEDAGIRYSHYAPLVEFVFLTGCRPSEAIGLRWGNVAEDCESVRFVESITISGRGKQIRVEGSKNNKKRVFPCSKRLTALLTSIKPEDLDPGALVFPSPKGKPINYNNFYSNA